MAILETKNLVKRFGGVYAVNGLSIKIEQGKITAIIGPNGSGKTTLINMLSGMLAMDSGTVVVGDSKTFTPTPNLVWGFTTIPPHQVSFYGITRTFQDVRLFEQMTVLDNILVVLTERNVFSAFFETHKEYHLKKAEEALQRVGLFEKKNQLAANCSYGQRKLLEIARVLAMDKEIILLDEPFSGLFPEMAKTVSKIIQELKQKGSAIILIEHNMHLIRELSDYIFVMDEGMLLAEGNPKEVLEKNEVIEAYLGE